MATMTHVDTFYFDKRTSKITKIPSFVKRVEICVDDDVDYVLPYTFDFSEAIELEELWIWSPANYYGSHVLKACTKLKTLYLYKSNITWCPPSVEKLTLFGNCMMRRMNHLVNLRCLHVSDNAILKVCPPSVEDLEICGSSVLVDLSRCVNLKTLNARENPYLTKCPPSVEELSAMEETCAMRDLSECKNLRKLVCHQNKNIRDVPSSVEELYACDTNITDVSHCWKLQKHLLDPHIKTSKSIFVSEEEQRQEIIDVVNKTMSDLFQSFQSLCPKCKATLKKNDVMLCYRTELSRFLKEHRLKCSNLRCDYYRIVSVTTYR